MWLGVDYYPEQWDAALLEQDLDTIAELGCNVIRIGEFAWHLMEKEEGKYDFSFFDRVIERAGARGLSVIFGTPTATIPAWLAKKEPSVLSEFENGQKRSFGGRHVYCFHSPVMYRYSEKIIRALAEHYKEEPAIVAWQIDNEFGHEGSDVCYCAQCRRAFGEYLKKKFDGDIARLNDTFGTSFWSQEYNSFDEIPTPMATITTHNPALRLEWERFRSQAIVDFAEFQVRLLREILPGATVIHDFSGGGLTKHVDFARLAEPLDVAAYNNYPVWGGQREPIAPHEIAFGLDYIRGLKSKNFWITEAIMGAQGHDVTGFAPRPNQAKMWSYQGFAHGCDSMLYFRYRGATKGAEQFCYGVLDADNVKRRKFYEVQSCFADVKKYQKALEAPMKAEVALVYDYDSLAAFRIQRQSVLLDVPAEMQKIYKTFYDRNVPVDVVPATADLLGYKIVVLSQMIVEKPEFTARVQRFVREGGTLVMTYRTAVKDTHNNLVFGEPLPLHFSSFAGVTVAETESLQAGQEFQLIGKGGFAGHFGTGGIFRDLLEVNGAEVLYSYGDEFYRNFAAVTVKKQGDGRVYYVGCGLDAATGEALTARLMAEQGIEGEQTAPGVEVTVRGEGENRVRVILNHTGKPAAYRDTPLSPYEARIEPV